MSEIIYPIDHWSYSSLKEFLRNRFMFKRKYILKIYDNQISPSMIVGKAAHKALETILKGGTVDEGMAAGLALIQRQPDEMVKWGKTGSKEQVIKDFTKAVNAYVSEIDLASLAKSAVGVEKTITAYIELNGVKAGVPAKGVMDLIVRKENKRLGIIDHKFVRSYTDGKDERGDMMIQAMFNFHLVKAEYGEDPEEFIFNECRPSTNRNGDAQVQPYVIRYADHPEYFSVFAELYDACTAEIAKPDCLYLPNFSDMMDNVETFQNFKAQSVGIKAPIMVQHKTKVAKFAEKNYTPSPTDLVDNKHLTDEEKIRVKLQEFGIAVEMQKTHRGLNIIRYTLKPSRGTRMSSFEKHAKDIQIALQAKSVRVDAPIMGTNLVGIEVPNPKREFIKLELDKFGKTSECGTLQIPIGVNVMGEWINRDLSEMPHLLVAGATGSGKSVMINVAIQALIQQNTAEQMKLVLIDPKRVELSRYKNDPHVMAKPIYEIDEAVKTLRWLVDEMERRYNLLENVGAVKIDDYNQMNPPLSKIVVVIDEFADLMLQADNEMAEKCIVRIAQKSRAVGIHLILGTQRPSVDVVTGVIKANLPCRIAFRTAQRVDSQVILDVAGAEQLSGKGDCLFLDPHSSEIMRLQSFYV